MNRTFPLIVYGLYAVTIFTSSFLLFQVQPLISKHILPWFGGSSSVWMTALFFFTVALALGYVYVFFIARIRVAFQVCIHLTSLLMVLGITTLNTVEWPSVITPPLLALFTSGENTIVLTIRILTIAVGAPFILLASTSSLIQLWYAKTSGKEPFSLYAVSNIGSLLGLLSYPMLFEPLLSTISQGKLWSYSFYGYCGLLVLVMLHVVCTEHIESAKMGSTNETNRHDIEESYQQFLIWMLVAMVPVITMLMGTTYLTTVIAPIPLLWVIPLALYLVSFIVSFQERFRIPFTISVSATFLFFYGSTCNVVRSTD